MKITDFLSPSEVAFETRTFTKSALLLDLAARAAAVLGIDARQVAEALQKREDLGSTGMGGGVAIPHARLDSVKRPFGMLMELKRAIEFDAVDGKPVDIVFLLLIPSATDGDPMNALASVARKLRSAETLQRLRRSTSGEALYEAISTEA